MAQSRTDQTLRTQLVNLLTVRQAHMDFEERRSSPRRTSTCGRPIAPTRSGICWSTCASASATSSTTSRPTTTAGPPSPTTCGRTPRRPPTPPAGSGPSTPFWPTVNGWWRSCAILPWTSSRRCPTAARTATPSCARSTSSPRTTRITRAS
ncbi:MAG: hypothetical protein R2851_03450 [Caldilineaceae bacterium]